MNNYVQVCVGGHDLGVRGTRDFKEPDPSGHLAPTQAQGQAESFSQNQRGISHAGSEER